MLDILKTQFDSGNVFASNKNYGVIRGDKIPSYFWDMYPLAQDYYHELNPFFVGKIYHPDLFNLSKVMTVRDGYVGFANFLLTHYSKFSKLGTQLFLIPPEFTKLVPQNLLPYFGTWTIVQSPKKVVSIEKAKKIFLFTFPSEEYLGNLETLEDRLAPLKKANKDATIQIYAPVRKNVFGLNDRECLTTHRLVSAIKDALPNRKVDFIDSKHFFDVSDFKDTFILDLAHDRFVVADSYLHYYCLSRGATVSSISSKAPVDSIFSLALSFDHDLHISPLPKVESEYADLILYSKTTTTKDYLRDPNFQAMLRGLLK